MINGLISNADFLETVWMVTLTLALVMCLSKQFMYRHYEPPLQEVREFLSNRLNSIDCSRQDSAARKKTYQHAANTIRVMFAVAVIDQIMIMVPNSQRDRLFNIPPVIYSLGPLVASVSLFWYLFMFTIIWFAKYFCCTATLTVLMLGLRTEFQVLSYKFTDILQQVQCEQTSVVSGSTTAQVKFWCKLQKSVKITLDQHMALLE